MSLSAQERAFADQVREHWLVTGRTQASAAAEIGLARSKFSEVCNGHRLPADRATLDRLIDVLGMDRARTIELWEAARRARDRRARSPNLTRLRPPDGWGARPVLPAEVRSLLQAQRDAAQRFPYRLPHARHTTLATVYVRQGLGTEIHQTLPEQSRPVPVSDERGVLFVPAAPATRLAVRPPSRTLRDVLDEHEHMLVTGGPGRGKSTMTLRLAADIATAWTALVADGGQPITTVVVPLRLTAASLAAQLTLPFPHALAAAVSAEYHGLLHTEVSADILAQPVLGCRWLLLVDGLDEVTNEDQRDRLVQVLARWTCDDTGESPYRVILTTRPIESTALAPLQLLVHFELQPFDEDALQRFAAKWFEPEGADAAQRFLQQIRYTHLDEIVQVPLLATIAAVVFTQHPDRELPDNQYELYEEYLDILQTARPAPDGRFEQLRRNLLEHLGHVRLHNNTSLIAAARDWTIQHTQRAERPPGWQGELILFLTAAGPLQQRGNDLQFLHHSFAEHLAASARARTLPSEFEPEHPEFASLVHIACQDIRGRYARSVLLHYARQQRISARADRLIDCLHHGNVEHQQLAAQLLAHHVPASSQVVEEFLATVRAWTMIERYVGHAILSQVSRATHHPGLAPWLADLLHDDTAPWPTRIEAATALAVRLRAAREEATALLCSVIGDEAIPVEHRLTAAEGLARCGVTERDAAEHGLRALLVVPSAPARSRRNAAVVLAGMGLQNRAFAVELLTRALDDRQTPVADHVEYAAGLAEIDVTYHERSADVFHAILRNRGLDIGRRTQAAIALAKLGPARETEAVRALIALAADRRLEYWHRATAARTLAEIGPQHRAAAAQTLLGMLNEPNVSPTERWHCALGLARLGSEFREAAHTHFRASIRDRKAGSNATLWASTHMLELGPEVNAEAAEGLQHVATDPFAEEFEHAQALAELAKLGEPYQRAAIEQLRLELVDRHTAPAARVQAATQLLDLGPEFRTDLSIALQNVVSRPLSPDLLIEAWNTLATLDTRFRRPAADALLSVLRSSPGLWRYSWEQAARQLAALGAGYQQQAADVLSAMLADTGRSSQTRSNAAAGLISLGQEFQRAAVDGLVALLREHSDRDVALDLDLPPIATIGPGLACEVVDALRALMLDAGTGLDLRRWAARALADLGLGDAPDVPAVLRAAVADTLATPSDRAEMAIALAKLEGESDYNTVTALLRLLLHRRPGSTPDWTIRALIRLSDNAQPLLLAMLNNPETDRATRADVASLLADLNPSLVEVAAAVLQRQADDQHLDLQARLAVAQQLAELDTTTSDTAIALHQTAFDDEDEPIAARCDAASGLVRLDRSRWPTTVVGLRLLAADSRTMPDEHHRIFEALREAKALRSDTDVMLALAVIRDPQASPQIRARMCWFLPPDMQREFQHVLLEDYTASIYWRVNVAKHNVEYTLQPEAEAAVREVLDAVESTRLERVIAAQELAALSAEHVDDGAQVLEDLAGDHGPAAFKALSYLANLSTTRKRYVLDECERMVADKSMPLRTRCRAANLIVEIAPEPTTWPVAFLRQLAAETQISDIRRADTHYTLRHANGLSPLRALRDNPRATPWARCRAAIRLTAYTAEDRAAAAQLLGDIAADPTSRPALRWKVCSDLAELGTPGRTRACEALQAMLADDTLPTTARAQAAKLLATIRPSRAHEMVDVLHELVGEERPLRRRQVFLAMGAINGRYAVPPLRAMALDQRLDPVARLRSAEALVQLQRDQHEIASTVVRELMHDQQLPVHIRCHAARNLARWSKLCRQEARDLLHAMTTASRC